MPSSPLPLAVRVIRAEHDALSAMLRTVPLLLDAQRRAGSAPDFGALRAMLFYVDEFPERLHHKKESELLFSKLRARAPELRDTLDDLEADHAQGERAIRELQHSLLAWEQMGEARRAKFEQQLKVYAARILAALPAPFGWGRAYCRGVNRPRPRRNAAASAARAPPSSPAAGARRAAVLPRWRLRR